MRKPGFGEGLLIGVCATVVVLSYSSYSNQFLNWWTWTGGLVTSDDSLAQWLMTILSLIAAILIWRTLRKTGETLDATRQMAEDTRKMARDSRKIGEAQTRAFISIGATTIEYVSNSDSLSLTTRLSNHGNSPAENILLTVKAPMLGIARTQIIGTLDAKDEEVEYIHLGALHKLLPDSKHGSVGIVVDLWVSYRHIFSEDDIRESTSKKLSCHLNTASPAGSTPLARVTKVAVFTKEPLDG